MEGVGVGCVCRPSLGSLFSPLDPTSWLLLTGPRSRPSVTSAGLRRVTKGNPHVKDVRGVGLLVGVELDQPAGPVVGAARDMGVLAITAGNGDIIRMVGWNGVDTSGSRKMRWEE